MRERRKQAGIVLAILLLPCLVVSQTYDAIPIGSPHIRPPPSPRAEQNQFARGYQPPPRPSTFNPPRSFHSQQPTYDAVPVQRQGFVPPAFRPPSLNLDQRNRNIQVPSNWQMQQLQQQHPQRFSNIPPAPLPAQIPRGRSGAPGQIPRFQVNPVNNIIIHLYLNSKDRMSHAELRAPVHGLFGIGTSHGGPGSHADPIIITKDFDRDTLEFIEPREADNMVKNGPANIVEVKAIVSTPNRQLENTVNKAVNMELNRAIPVVMDRMKGASMVSLDNGMRKELEEALVDELARNLGETIDNTDINEDDLSKLIEEGFEEVEKAQTETTTSRTFPTATTTRATTTTTAPTTPTTTTSRRTTSSTTTTTRTTTSSTTRTPRPTTFTTRRTTTTATTTRRPPPPTTTTTRRTTTTTSRSPTTTQDINDVTTSTDDYEYEEDITEPPKKTTIVITSPTTSTTRVWTTRPTSTTRRPSSTSTTYYTDSLMTTRSYEHVHVVPGFRVTEQIEDSEEEDVEIVTTLKSRPTTRAYYTPVAGHPHHGAISLDSEEDKSGASAPTLTTANPVLIQNLPTKPSLPESSPSTFSPPLQSADTESTYTFTNPIITTSPIEVPPNTQVTEVPFSTNSVEWVSEGSEEPKSTLPSSTNASSNWTTPAPRVVTKSHQDTFAGAEMMKPGVNIDEIPVIETTTAESFAPRLVTDITDLHPTVVIGDYEDDDYSDADEIGTTLGPTGSTVTSKILKLLTDSIESSSISPVTISPYEGSTPEKTTAASKAVTDKPSSSTSTPEIPSSTPLTMVVHESTTINFESTIPFEKSESTTESATTESIAKSVTKVTTEPTIESTTESTTRSTTASVTGATTNLDSTTSSRVETITDSSTNPISTTESIDSTQLVSKLPTTSAANAVTTTTIAIPVETSTTHILSTISTLHTSSDAETSVSTNNAQVDHMKSTPKSSSEEIQPTLIRPNGPCPTPNQSWDRNRTDVLFLLDSSDSFNEVKFHRAIELIKNTVKHFNNFGSDGLQVSLVQYNDDPYLEFSLRKHNCKKTLIDDIDDTEYMAGGSQLGKALSKVSQFAFTKKRGDRPDAENVLIIVTDGQSEDRVQKPTRLAKENNVTVLVISTIEADKSYVSELAGHQASNQFDLDVDPSHELSWKLARRIADVSTSSQTSVEPSSREAEKNDIGSSASEPVFPAKSINPNSHENDGIVKLECVSDGFKITVTPPEGFHGIAVVKGYQDDARCKSTATADGEVHMFISNSECGVTQLKSQQPNGLNSSLVLHLLHDKQLNTGEDRAYLLQCFVGVPQDSEVSTNLDVIRSELTIAETISLSTLPPTCTYSIRRNEPDGPIATKAVVGETVYHRWDCDGSNETTNAYGIQIHSCYASDDVQRKFAFVDPSGCSSDLALLSDLTYDDSTLSAYAASHVFSVHNAESLKFVCKLSLCTRDGDGCEGVTPPNCGNNANRSDLLLTRRLLRNQNSAVDEALTSALSTKVGLTNNSGEGVGNALSSLIANHFFWLLAIAAIATVIVIAVMSRRHSDSDTATTCSDPTSMSESQDFGSPVMSMHSGEIGPNQRLSEFMRTFDRSRYV
ncbi:unnamed protein product [Caenorhabditis bovis]|uniref:Uncharacterized protein n=1 Tax=Caenorhabditis bovis TaxID=2654633 RepID=A0A8S1ET44_9PELO|nr:unnamed protein product [Caenorhabditis bovis]